MHTFTWIFHILLIATLYSLFYFRKKDTFFLNHVRLLSFCRTTCDIMPEFVLR